MSNVKRFSEVDVRDEDPDAMKGAVEGDRPDDRQDSNANAGALDENGLPEKTLPICEDAIGANVDNRGRDAGAADAAVFANETGKV
jgi:hypothetical protein